MVSLSLVSNKWNSKEAVWYLWPSFIGKTYRKNIGPSWLWCQHYAWRGVDRGDKFDKRLRFTNFAIVPLETQC